MHSRAKFLCEFLPVKPIRGRVMRQDNALDMYAPVDSTAIAKVMADNINCFTVVESCFRLTILIGVLPMAMQFTSFIC